LKNISLLPSEIKKQKESRQKQRIAVIAGIGVLGVLLLAFGGLYTAASVERAQVAEQEERIENLEERIGELEKYAQMKEEVEEMKDHLREAMGNAPPWDIFLAELSGSIPGNVWMGNLSADFEEEEEGGTVNISGITHSHEDLSSWLQKLYRLDYLDNIRCRYSEKTEGDFVTEVHFNIQANLKPGEPYEMMMEGGE